MAVRGTQGPTTTEQLFGGDTYKGHYLPPHAARTLKEMQAEQAAAAREAASPTTDAFTPPAKPTRRQHSAETTQRLEDIANAPDLKTALDGTMRMPELVELAKSRGLVTILEDKVPDRDTKARSVGTSLIIEGKSNTARYYGTDKAIFAAPNGNKLALGLSQAQLFGYASMASNRYGTQTDEKVSRIRTGLGRFLPWSTGADGVQASMPELTPKTLAAAIQDTLETK